MVNNNTATLVLSPSVTPLAACRAASVLVLLLGQDRLSSGVRTQLVLRPSCERTGRSGRGNAGAGVCSERSVPQWPVARSCGDVQEGGAHQPEGLFAERCHVIRSHPFCLDLWKDLQSDGTCARCARDINVNSDVAHNND